MELPQPESLEQIQKSNKKMGRAKTFVDQLQASWLPVLTLLFIGYGIYNENKFDSLEQKLTVTNQNIVNLTQETPNSIKNSEVESIKSGSALGANTEFNPDDWIIESFELNKEGFYCSLTNKFDYWSIWSKATYPPVLGKIKVKILTKPKPGSRTPPTISISYGEFKPNFSPIQFYRLNIFDTDNKSMRLYNSENDSVSQGYLVEDPDLGSEMSIILSPRNPDPDSRILNLNPSLEYALPGKDRPIEFRPDEKFEVSLPTVGIEDGTVRKQIGIGSSKNTCFKPIAVEIR